MYTLCLTICVLSYFVIPLEGMHSEKENLMQN